MVNRWVYDLVSTIDRLGCSDIFNDCRSLNLPVFSPEEVAKFVTRMLSDRGVPFEREVKLDLPNG